MYSKSPKAATQKNINRQNGHSAEHSSHQTGKVPVAEVPTSEANSAKANSAEANSAEANSAGVEPLQTTPKRFIAGAVCPRCGQMDRIVAVVGQTEAQYRECVACGFNEGLDNQQVQPELETRVNKKPGANTIAKPLRFYRTLPDPL